MSTKSLFELCENDEVFETIFKEVIESRQTRPPVFRIESPEINGTTDNQELDQSQINGSTRNSPLPEQEPLVEHQARQSPHPSEQVPEISINDFDGEKVDETLA